MSEIPSRPVHIPHVSRRDALRLAAAGAVAPFVAAGASSASAEPAAAAAVQQSATAPAPAGWVVRPFATAVSLSPSLFTANRDRVLNFLRSYSADRMLAVFRANAGLDTHGAQPPGGWETADGNLRGHYAGHFLSALALAYAGSGDQFYRGKVDYMVSALGQCQDALEAASPIATTPSGDGTELTGTVTLRYALSTFTARMSGTGFGLAGTSLTRTVSLDPGASTSVKVQLGAIAAELPESATEYQPYSGYDPQTAWLTQMAEYNRFWVDNVPYVDIPDPNVKKISYYRTWENRFNSFDGNIPGNDYQFPVDLEGALGYNNQISLTVPMRLQDLQFWRDPLYSYGPWLSQGEESGCQAFHDNPGNTGNWNNT